MASRPCGAPPAHHHFVSAQQPRPPAATVERPTNPHITRSFVPFVPAHGSLVKSPWAPPFSNTYGVGLAARHAVQHVSIASGRIPGSEIGGASHVASLASPLPHTRATSSHASYPEPSVSSAQACADRTASRLLADLHSKADNLPAEYFEDRKPTDPFFYPTTVNPLTTVGIRAIEKSVPRVTGSPARPPFRLETDDDGPCFVSAPLQNFVEGEQMELIQQQNDNLSKQVQALEHAKSLAAAQNHQNASQIAARNEQLRREAQLAIARSRELQSDACSPESSKLRSAGTLQDEVTFEPPIFSTKSYDPSAGLREDARSWVDGRYGLRENAQEDNIMGSVWPSGTRALSTSMLEPMAKYDMPTQPLEQNLRPHDAFDHTMSTSDFAPYDAKAFYDTMRASDVNAWANHGGASRGGADDGQSGRQDAAGADAIGAGFPYGRGSPWGATQNIIDAGGSLPYERNGVSASVSVDAKQNPHDIEGLATQLLLAHQPQGDTSRGGEHLDTYEQVEPFLRGYAGQAKAESSDDPWLVELECALETVALSSKSILNSKNDLAELNKISRPHPVVKSVAEAALTVLGLLCYLKDKSHLTWVNLRKALLDRSFLEKLKSFRLDDVTKPQFQKLRKLLLQTDFDEELIKTHCMPIVPLSIWARAVGVSLSLRNFPDGPEIRPVAHAMGPSLPSTPVYVPVCEPYEVEPDFSTFGPEELKRVPDLTVSRPHVASITFHGLTDCTDMDLPSVIQLEVGEVLVYPNASSKPPIGFGLNKSATVTMYQCWPPDSDAVLNADGRDKYRKKIQHMTEVKNARFIDYNCHTGIWKFDVDHF
eukprot:GEMP01011762.1.p1 GENE.GEMP01011762.1~~GEMP01011762.1.p1  ORF type:complete len:823 (+),score=163.08 GEMP01011762.1:119-2587(+)